MRGGQIVQDVRMEDVSFHCALSTSRSPRRKKHGRYAPLMLKQQEIDEEPGLPEPMHDVERSYA
jgi:hypothetical protein